jgi:hypothetical protein
MRRCALQESAETTCAVLCWSASQWRRARALARSLFIAEAGRHAHAVAILRAEGRAMGLPFVVCWMPWAVRLRLSRRRRP